MKNVQLFFFLLQGLMYSWQKIPPVPFISWLWQCNKLALLVFIFFSFILNLV